MRTYVRAHVISHMCSRVYVPPCVDTPACRCEELGASAATVHPNLLSDEKAGPVTGGATRGAVMTVAQQKGGTGKTSTVSTLGDALQRRAGRRILLVDLDPQASLTEWLLPPEDAVVYGVEDLLLGQIDDAEKVLVRLRTGLDLLPATNGLLDAAAAIERKNLGRERALADVLTTLLDDYDLIIVDGPPRLDGLTINGLFAADWLLIPVETSALSMYAARDLLALVREVEQVRGRELPLLGLLPTSVRRSTNSEETLSALNKRYPLLPPIRQTVRVEEAPAVHRLLLDHAPECSAAQDYAVAAAAVAVRLGWER